MFNSECTSIHMDKLASFITLLNSDYASLEICEQFTINEILSLIQEIRSDTKLKKKHNYVFLDLLDVIRPRCVSNIIISMEELPLINDRWILDNYFILDPTLSFSYPESLLPLNESFADWYIERFEDEIKNYQSDVDMQILKEFLCSEELLDVEDTESVFKIAIKSKNVSGLAWLNRRWLM